VFQVLYGRVGDGGVRFSGRDRVGGGEFRAVRCSLGGGGQVLSGRDKMLYKKSIII
jgi:hypothetical protein